MRADNTAHLARAVQARQADTRRRAVSTLTQLEQRDEAITVSARPAQSTDNSWQSRLAAAQTRIRDLTTENEKLRRQLAAAHGQRRTEQGL